MTLHNDNFDHIFLDLLFPAGEDGWPSASAAIEPTPLSALHSIFRQPEVVALLAALAPLQPQARIARLQQFEHDSGALFDQLYAAVLTAYYSAPLVAAKARQLADAGPREPSPYFDRSLVQQVVATGAGRRRM